MKIDVDGNWRLYTEAIPERSRAIGTVRRDTGETGALVVTGAGIYVQVNNGAVRPLDQREARRLLPAVVP